MDRRSFLGMPLGLAANAAAAIEDDARALLDYLRRLPEGKQRRYLVGQFTAFPRWLDYEYPRVIDRLHEVTGKWPAILGLDFGATRRDPADDDLFGAVARAIDYWRAGGLVTFSWHARNPWTRGSAWDAAPRPLSQLLEPGPAREQWRRDLDRVAGALAALQTAGVVVLWRPFHEMNGRWFWWGGAGRDEFVALWKATHAHLTRERGLRNLLWVYSASSGAHRRVSADHYYPGDDVCDVVGLDNYSDDVVWEGYAELVRLGKPFAATEFGPEKEAGRFDYARLEAALRERYARTVYVLVWGSQWALANNRNAGALLDSPAAVTRAAIAFRSAR